MGILKAIITKLVCLGVLLGGVLLLLTQLGLTSVAEVLDRASIALQVDLSRQLVELGLAAVMIVLGGFALLPGRRVRVPKRHISFEGQRGEVVIQLDPVQAQLTRVLLNMPEIRRVDVRVEPDATGRNAVIFADAVLESQPGVCARETVQTVTEYIADAARGLMGLEDLSHIHVNVTGIHLNPKKSSKVVREHAAARSAMNSALQLSYAGAAATATVATAQAQEIPVTVTMPAETETAAPPVPEAVEAAFSLAEGNAPEPEMNTETATPSEVSGNVEAREHA